MEHSTQIEVVSDSIINPVYNTNNLLLIIALILVMILFTLNKIYNLKKNKKQDKDNEIRKGGNGGSASVRGSGTAIGGNGGSV